MKTKILTNHQGTNNESMKNEGTKMDFNKNYRDLINEEYENYSYQIWKHKKLRDYSEKNK